MTREETIKILERIDLFWVTDKEAEAILSAIRILKMDYELSCCKGGDGDCGL